MGLADRDYMRERWKNQTPTRRSSLRDTSPKTWWIVAAVVVTVVAVLAAL